MITGPTVIFDQVVRQQEEIKDLRQKISELQADSSRIDFMDAYGGECICQLGDSFYFRSGYGRPHGKAKTLREAIDGAMKLKAQG
jgi:hypothetical protein